ncbi:hypothetical protein SARC_15399 [Sphaeroforma arctica JP610]|uniref:Uncharacterized protein n=1 Tax=Sphaeroforma arctica JP610 TaxID=667725 RepID=A0A0L0F5Y8_9EUKA|nr:hypothetical protein SARC_15399 [Sphaeroforma arctica JP610]KNC72054.1 hypothetical protein SARC_15399 [Sphaeroforma arctica JP610]|eukprot:XP_014145956.1 hypothetical protein SARC_15399 [Sphaeroforma arctica JP610]
MTPREPLSTLAPTSAFTDTPQSSASATNDYNNTIFNNMGWEGCSFLVSRTATAGVHAVEFKGRLFCVGDFCGTDNEPLNNT